MKNTIATNFANPYLPLWEHLPDGEPRVFEDPDNPGQYRIYIIGSHDVRYDSYCGPDIRAWSAPVDNLNNWRDEGSIFTYKIDGQWDVMFAPDLVEIKRKDGTKDYYLYPHSRGPGREAMVAMSNRPTGPFAPINMTKDGKSTLPGSIMGFDPAVYIDYITNPADPDYEIGFRAYAYWGFQRSFAAELDQSTMYSLRPGREICQYFIPASSKYGAIRDPEGTTYPSVYPSEDLSRFNFFEAASIRKIGNKYVWVYSGYSGPDYGLSSTNSALRYAYSDAPLGPWKSGGVLVDSRAVDMNPDGTALETYYAGHNTHGSVEEINGQWYVFYHRAPRNHGGARQPMVAPIDVNWDEALVADGGKVVIRACACKARGHEYTGAEVTSEGFNMYGLDPYRYYSAGIACFLSDHSLQADAWDIWDDHMPVVNVADGDIVGYRYFGFGGLGEQKNGLRPFSGAKKGNETQFNLFLLPKTDDSFTISVWLDAPWDNDAWKGSKIGEINVPAGAAKCVTKYMVDVSAAVEGLQGKNAIYLVAEGGGPLCDYVGLGFSSKDISIYRPTVPTVSISVNGKAVELPGAPTRSTNENGICDYSRYDVKVSLPAGTTKAPMVEACASVPDVLVTVEMTGVLPSEAVVRFDYMGVVKTYNIELCM